MSLRTRFAPSPTGLIHLGTAASALHVWAAAEAAGGEVLLRIEDVDKTRCRPEFAQAMLEDLAWLGLSWPEPVRVQSAHFDAYQAVLEALSARGLVYRCFRTRKEVAELAGEAPFVSSPPPPEEEAARLARGEVFAWRLSLSAARAALGGRFEALEFVEETEAGLERRKAEPGRHGDVVLARKDAPAAYHLASTHDDALQGVSHVVRGTDLADAAHIHVLIQALMGWPSPVYRHHPLIYGPDGKKLSKSARSKTLASLREAGFTPADVRALAGF